MAALGRSMLLGTLRPQPRLTRLANESARSFTASRSNRAKSSRPTRPNRVLVPAINRGRTPKPRSAQPSPQSSDKKDPDWIGYFYDDLIENATFWSLDNFESLKQRAGKDLDISASDALECVKDFVHICRLVDKAIPGEQGWNRVAQELRARNISADVLYETSCLLHSTRVVGVITWTMSQVACDMDCERAIISATKVHVRRDSYRTTHPYTRTHLDKFDEILRAGKSPAATFVHGQYLLREKQHDRAIKTFQDALRIADWNFQWKAECEYSLAMAYQDTGRDEEALELLQSEEHKLERFRFSDFLVGRILRETDPDKAYEHFVATTEGYSDDMTAEMVEFLFERAEAEEDAAKKEWFTLEAKEWLLLNDARREVHKTQQEQRKKAAWRRLHQPTY